MVRPRPCPPLAQELVDHIMDYLDVEEEDKSKEYGYDDMAEEREKAKAALRSCTLVSRSWSARSYALYRHTVHLNDGSVSPLSTFRALLSSSPRLRASIQVLWIRGTDGTSTVSRVDPESLVTLLDCLEDLHTVIMHRVVCNVRDKAVQHWNRTAPLQHLGLYGVETTTSEDFVLTAALFAKVPVRKLAIVTYAGDMEEPELGPLYSQHAALFSDWQVGEVEVGKESASGLLDILPATQIRCLRSLTLPEIYPGATPLRLIRLGRFVGLHVTRLRMDITPPWNKHTLLPTKTTAAAVCFFLSLETLELDWFVGNGLELIDSLGRCNHLEIVKHVSRSIRHIVFRFSRSHPPCWTSSSAPPALCMLQSELLSLPNLQSLTTTACESYPRPPLLFTRDVPVSENEVKKMQEALPRLSQAGKLRFNKVMGHREVVLVAI